jgi:hypothetical protein
VIGSSHGELIDALRRGNRFLRAIRHSPRTPIRVGDPAQTRSPRGFGLKSPAGTAPTLRLASHAGYRPCNACTDSDADRLGNLDGRAQNCLTGFNLRGMLHYLYKHSILKSHTSELLNVRTVGGSWPGCVSVLLAHWVNTPRHIQNTLLSLSQTPLRGLSQTVQSSSD